MDTFIDYAYYYDVFNRDKDYNREACMVDKLIKRFGLNVKKIVDFGCGTGKHDIELSNMGYDVHGIDISEFMIEMANNNNKNDHLSYEVSDIRKYASEARYDAVISLFHVMSYQNTNQDIMDAFSSARAVINKGCVFIFDVWYGPGVLSERPSVRIKKIEEGGHRFIRMATPVMYESKNVVDVNYEIIIIDKESRATKNVEETHSMRYFFRPEIDLMLHLSGFELIDNYDCKDLGDTSYDSWTSYFVARAI